MPITQIPSQQILDGGIQRADLCTAGVGGTNVIAKALQGVGIQLSSTGGDAGTGDVTVNLAQIAAGSVLGNSSGATLAPSAITAWTNPPWLTSLPWSKITGTPTTVAGYGITDSDPALTGDVTKAANSTVTALANIPNTTPAAGSIAMAQIASPTSPASGAKLYVDSTSKAFCSKDQAGNIGHVVRTQAVTAKNWINGINDDGSISIGQPTWNDLFGTPTTLAGYGIASPLPIAQGGTGATTGAEPPLGNPATSGWILSSTTGGVRSWIAPPSGGGTITLTGDVTGSGTSSINAQIASGVVGSNEINNAQDLAMTVAQSIALSDAGTTTAPIAFTLKHLTSGTPAAGMGVNMTFQAETTSLSARTLGDITYSWIDATEATRTTKLVIRGQANGLFGSNSLTMFSSGSGPSLALGSAGDPGAGWMNVPTGYKTNGTQIGYKDLSTSPAFASYNSPTATNPTGNSSGANVFLMQGLGGAAKITPAITGKVLIIITGSVANSVASGYAFTVLYYGTGTAPANNAASTGTSTGAQSNYVGSTGTATMTVPFCLTALVTGLAVGTQYWMDVGVNRNSTGVASLTGVTVTAIEIP